MVEKKIRDLLPPAVFSNSFSLKYLIWQGVISWTSSKHRHNFHLQWNVLPTILAWTIALGAERSSKYLSIFHLKYWPQHHATNSSTLVFPNLGKILPLMGYLASGDIFGCHSYGREMLLAIYWLERKDDAKDTVMHSSLPQPRIIGPQISIVSNLRNPDLHWKACN